MIENEWQLLKMAVNMWKGVNSRTVNCCKQLLMDIIAINSWKWLSYNGWKWMKMTYRGWKQLEMSENGCKMAE